MRRPTRKTSAYEFLAIAIPVLILLGAILFGLTYIDNLDWRFAALKADLKYAFNPPEQVVFIPRQASTTQPAKPAGVGTSQPSPSLTPVAPLDTPTPPPAATPTFAPLPTTTPTPLPARAELSGLLHQFQMMNNCGPANLAMALSYWGWKGDQRATAAILKPNKFDKNVMPYEMEEYVEQETDLQAVVRAGGDLQIIKAFVSAGFPVIAEKGFEDAGFDGWMGHYQVITGYDDAQAHFIVQDSFKGPDLTVPYDSFERDWRDFNYTYMVVYPEQRRQQVLDILGFQALDNYNHRTAETKANADVARLSGRELFFALFNQGSSKVALQDYAAAATAYDAAFANYAQLPEADRPWRMLWYQTGPYYAYFYTGRFQDVVDLATQTLETMSDPILEESFLWRARAYVQLGQTETAIEDLQMCLEVHPDFSPCVEELNKLGVAP